jgi:hypothetical protein
MTRPWRHPQAPLRTHLVRRRRQHWGPLRLTLTETVCGRRGVLDVRPARSAASLTCEQCRNALGRALDEFARALGQLGPREVKRDGQHLRYIAARKRHHERWRKTQ